MPTTKEEIKEWLKEIGKDRFWLAIQCSTGKRAVDKWFEKKGEVPAKAILVIQQLMADTGWKNPEHKLEDLPNKTALGKMFITLPPEIQDMVYEEALRQGLSVSAYCSLAVEYAAANSDMRDIILKMLSDKKKSAVKSPASDTNIIVGLATNEEEPA